MDVQVATYNRLRAYAKKHKLTGYSKLKVDELRSLVLSHQLAVEGGALDAAASGKAIASELNRRKVHQRGSGYVYPTSGLGTFANSPQLARHLPGFDPSQFI